MEFESYPGFFRMELKSGCHKNFHADWPVEVLSKSAETWSLSRFDVFLLSGNKVKSPKPPNVSDKSFCTFEAW